MQKVFPSISCDNYSQEQKKYFLVSRQFKVEIGNFQLPGVLGTGEKKKKEFVTQNQSKIYGISVNVIKSSANLQYSFKKATSWLSLLSIFSH